MSPSKTSSTMRLLHTGSTNYDHAYLDAGELFFSKALKVGQCPCCEISLAAFEHELPGTVLEPYQCQVRWLHVEICPHCGWWNFKQDYYVETDHSSGQPYRTTNWELTHAIQAEINIASEELPLDQLQQHLSRRWEDRTLISAQQAEDFVGGLLKDHLGGEIRRLTANANTADGGIDLYLSSDADGNIQRAIQIKRRISQDVEGVAEVRNFVGAMVLEGVDQGIFVTTASRFSKPATKTPAKASEAKFKLKLELIDGEQLLEMLHATTSASEAKLPPLVKLDQIWVGSHGKTVLAKDLFLGDLNRAISV